MKGNKPQPCRTRWTASPSSAAGSTNGVRAGRELWAAIETPEGPHRRLPVWTTASWCLPSIRRRGPRRDRFRMSWAKSDPFDARVHRHVLLTHRSRPSGAPAAEIRGRPGTQGADPRLYPPRCGRQTRVLNQLTASAQGVSLSRALEVVDDSAPVGPPISCGVSDPGRAGHADRAVGWQRWARDQSPQAAPAPRRAVPIVQRPKVGGAGPCRAGCRRGSWAPCSSNSASTVGTVDA